MQFSIVMLIVNYTLFAAAQYNLVQDFAIVELPEKLSFIFQIKCMLISYLIIFYVLYLYFKNNEIKENELLENQDQLQEINCQLEEMQQEVETQKENTTTA